MALTRIRLVLFVWSCRLVTHRSWCLVNCSTYTYPEHMVNTRWGAGKDKSRSIYWPLYFYKIHSRTGAWRLKKKTRITYLETNTQNIHENSKNIYKKIVNIYVPSVWPYSVSIQLLGTHIPFQKVTQNWNTVSWIIAIHWKWRGKVRNPVTGPNGTRMIYSHQRSLLEANRLIFCGQRPRN